MKRTLLLLALAGLTLSTSGCILAVGAAAGTGYLISREIHDEFHMARVSRDADSTWRVTLETLEILKDVGTQVERDERLRKAEAKIDGADVEVLVEAYDLDATTIRIQAERLLVDSPETAEYVLNEILEHMEG